MSYYAKVIADSVSQFGKRLTTIEARYPRIIHSEILTHRDRARNSASSRAIPWPNMMERIENDPFIPIRFGSEQKGMQTGGEIDNPVEARRLWLAARDSAVKYAQELAALGVHKSICNRLTEPWMWITVVMTATNWKNFFRLRCHPDAEVHFQHIAVMIKGALDTSTPEPLEYGEWHLPYYNTLERKNLEVYAQGIELTDLECRISTARCARVSYLTQDGKRDVTKDLELFDRLVQGSGFGHWSPHEHVATPTTPDVTSGPYRGWIQYRKFFNNESAD